MYNYRIDILKLINQNRNPNVIVGNVILFMKAILKPFISINDDFIAFINALRNREQYTFQVASMEALLNDMYSPSLPNIEIVTLKATNVEPLASKYVGSSALGTKNSVNGWFLPNKSQASIAASISDNFIVYVEPTVLNTYKKDIENTLNYYMFSGLKFQVRSNKNIVNPELGLNQEISQNLN